MKEGLAGKIAKGFISSKLTVLLMIVFMVVGVYSSFSIDKTIDGKVSEVGTSAKNTGGQYPVKISLQETNADILSGMYVSIQFPIEKTKTSQAVLIPESAIITRGDLKGIYTVSTQNTAVLRWIRTGRSYGDNIEVLSGLKAEEQYITGAEGKLYNGAKITVE